MMPGMSHEGMMDESEVPPGWTYSPSSWLQRLPIIALGVFGFLIARYMAAYQFGHIDYVWEPFFSGEAGRNGTEHIITSDVSRAWPIARPEERRVGNECVTTFRFRWEPS